MGMIRTFIAIGLPDNVHHALADVQQRLRNEPGGSAGRWVRPENIHLTLKFLGDVEEASVPAISARMRRACAGVAPFEVTIEGTGCFPNTRRPRVVWAGIGKPHEMLSNLQDRVEKQMEALGMQREGRPYSPHLTLGYARKNARRHEIEALGRLVADDQPDRIATVLVEGITLFRSELTHQGAIYTALVRIALRPETG